MELKIVFPQIHTYWLLTIILICIRECISLLIEWIKPLGLICFFFNLIWQSFLVSYVWWSSFNYNLSFVWRMLRLLLISFALSIYFWVELNLGNLKYVGDFIVDSWWRSEWNIQVSLIIVSLIFGLFVWFQDEMCILVPKIYGI